MTAYYNEHDPFAAAWLRNLIAAGHIAPGDVDERDIQDVRPTDLTGYTQCHFFAGIGGWSRALRLAGIPDTERVWTGSCPCQPFSPAGQGKGFADERHLWPYWFWLIEQCAPPSIFGEQSASKTALPWIDLVQADLEGAGYAVGVADLCAAGVGAPHIRQRLWFVAHANGSRLLPGTLGGIHRSEEGAWSRHGQPQRPGATRGVADADGGHAGAEREQCSGQQRQFAPDSGARELDNTCGARSAAGLPESTQREGGITGVADDTSGELLGAGQRSADCGTASEPRPGPTNGFWRDADWLHCRDGRWRPVKPGTFPLAHGVPNRMGTLRGSGNAISPEVGAAFIRATM